MDKNVGGLDRTARLVIGSLLVVAFAASYVGFFQLGLTIGLAGLLVGAILLVTGTAEKCPINQVAGINTHER
ncbi:MAG: DUF2892 domain-containing protein [Halobacteriales archaeon]|nr:DUF2892 domain-containing protein [Halobacteriales archaeon]